MRILILALSFWGSQAHLDSFPVREATVVVDIESVETCARPGCSELRKWHSGGFFGWHTVFRHKYEPDNTEWTATYATSDRTERTATGPLFGSGETKELPGYGHVFGAMPSDIEFKEVLIRAPTSEVNVSLLDFQGQEIDTATENRKVADGYETLCVIPQCCDHATPDAKSKDCTVCGKEYEAWNPTKPLRIRYGEKTLTIIYPGYSKPVGYTADDKPWLNFRNQSENKKCADCGASPTMSCAMQFGCFVCAECSGRHRAKTFDSFRIIDVNGLDKITPIQQQKIMDMGGNTQVNSRFKSNKTISSDATRDEKGIYIEDKYFERTAAGKRIAKKPLRGDSLEDEKYAPDEVTTVQEAWEEESAPMWMPRGLSMSRLIPGPHASASAHAQPTSVRPIPPPPTRPQAPLPPPRHPRTCPKMNDVKRDLVTFYKTVKGGDKKPTAQELRSFAQSIGRGNIGTIKICREALRTAW